MLQGDLYSDILIPNSEEGYIVPFKDIDGKVSLMINDFGSDTNLDIWLLRHILNTTPEAPSITYQVSFDVRGGNLVASQIINKDEKAIQPVAPTKSGLFSDVVATNELADAITIAVEYGIIFGYKDGTFRPNDKITREEAMTMYARAMDIVKLAEKDINKIRNYKDAQQVSDWAYDSVRKTLSANVFNGRAKDLIAPKGTYFCGLLSIVGIA